MGSSDLLIRPMQESDVERVLAWRNHADVRRHMLNSTPIALEESRRWFQAATKDPSRRLLVAEEAGQGIGFVQFSGVAAGGVAEWGFYAAPGAPRGSGRKLGRLALDLAFGEFQLHKVCGQVLADNQASLGFHRAMGFREEGVLREHHRDGDGYRDLVCFGLLRSEWAPAAVDRGDETHGQT